MKRVLVLGSGGREHALCWHFSSHGHQIFCAPGSAGIAQVAECFSFKDKDELLEQCKRVSPDLIVIGPEAYLAEGYADTLEENGYFVFGPTQSAAQLECDKAFSKIFFLEFGIPTAKSKIIDQTASSSVLDDFRAPFVVKAAGLAAGKGVWIGESVQEAWQQARTFLKSHAQVVIEEFVSGKELSCFYLIDGDQFAYLGSARDHKRLLDLDEGPNTGGMGAISPAPEATPPLLEKVESEVVRPTLAGLRKRGLRYTGFLFVGLMINEKDIRVLEFNCRMGDPETQCLMQRLKSDLVSGIFELRAGHSPKFEFEDVTSLTVVVAAQGYPEKPQKDFGLGRLAAPASLRLFHSGTRLSDSHQWFAAGGRLFTVNALGKDRDEAARQIYDWMETQDFFRSGQTHFRRDIGRSNSHG